MYFYVLIFIACIISYPYQSSLRIPIFYVLFSLILILSCRKLKFNSIFLRSNSKIYIYYALLFSFLVSIITFLFSRKFDGIQFLLNDFGNVLIFFYLVVCFDKKHIDRLLKILLFLVLIISLVANYNSFILKYSSDLLNDVSFYWVYYGHNHISVLILLLIPLTFYFYKNKQYLLLIMIFYELFTLIYSFSRGAILSFFIVLFFYIKTFFKKTLLILFFIAFLLLLQIFYKKNNFLLVDKSLSINFIRVSYAKLALTQSKKSFLIGNGLDSYKNVNINDKSISLKSYYAMNVFLQTYFDKGVLGLVALLTLIYTIILYIKKNYTSVNKYLLFSLIAIFINFQIDFDYALTSVNFIVIILLAFI